MRTYTLHVSSEAIPGDPVALERAHLVRDGFSWGAFIFTAFWFFRHRLWLAGIAVLVAVVGFALVLDLLHVNADAAIAAEALLALLIGLEASSLRRWTYERRGKPAVDVVAAADRQEAEMKAFQRWLARRDAPRRATGGFVAPLAPTRPFEPVIGLFPEPEHSR